MSLTTKSSRLACVRMIVGKSSHVSHNKSSRLACVRMIVGKGSHVSHDKKF